MGVIGLVWSDLVGGEARLALAYIFRFGYIFGFDLDVSTYLSSSSNPP